MRGHHYKLEQDQRHRLYFIMNTSSVVGLLFKYYDGVLNSFIFANCVFFKCRDEDNLYVDVARI